MLESHYSKFILSYATAVFFTMVIGFLLGEGRIDLYLSMYILEFYVLSAVYGVRVSKWISFIFLLIFLVIVVYRVSLILYPVGR
ncbi:MAG: hypothetical protein DRN68_08670 [Thaumarchaeota archaeon]|nr:MAG: hypothetical protein DRN68_08670 [Nitrososphaerota archaeon]